MSCLSVPEKTGSIESSITQRPHWVSGPHIHPCLQSSPWKRACKLGDRWMCSSRFPAPGVHQNCLEGLLERSHCTSSPELLMQ